ncbi:MAG: acyl-CoA thioesterase [Elioraea sp.]|nr:acyl-CoA thioesterase [Elioraea sp.]
MTKRIGTRAEYRWFLAIPTRWMDNDAFGHVNNVVYYSWFDTAVARFLMETGALQPLASEIVGYVVETQCRYFAPVAFPETVTAGLRVARIGNSSVRYEIGIFRQQDDSAAAEGHFIHAYVMRATNRPTPVPETMRAVLARYLGGTG